MWLCLQTRSCIIRKLAMMLLKTWIIYRSFPIDYLLITIRANFFRRRFLIFCHPASIQFVNNTSRMLSRFITGSITVTPAASMTANLPKVSMFCFPSAWPSFCWWSPSRSNRAIAFSKSQPWWCSRFWPFTIKHFPRCAQSPILFFSLRFPFTWSMRFSKLLLFITS